MDKNFHYAVFIGRFQPPHIGHVGVIEEALEQARTVIILIGSANAARSAKNPFTYEERVGFMRSLFRQEVAEGRIILRPLNDRLYNDAAWIAGVQDEVNDAILEHANKGGVRLHGLADVKVALAGFNKDQSSYYLKLFPEWGTLDVSNRYGVFNATDIRKGLFNRPPQFSYEICPNEVVDKLKEFVRNPEYRRLLEEYEYLAQYKEEVKQYPWTGITADAICVQSGNVLLVRRGGQPGKGLLAIPGGFLDPNETVRQTAVRELMEETEISDSYGRIPRGKLDGFIDESATKVFDAPERDPRGRIVTHAFLFRLPDSRELFTVKGSDDAASASWHRLGDLRPEDFYADHWAILQDRVGL